jgi:hypothetical protein
MLEHLEKISLRNFDEEDEINNLTNAAVALSVQEEMAMHVHSSTFAMLTADILHRHELPEPDEDEITEFYSKDRTFISDSIKACLPTVNAPDEPTNPFDRKTTDVSSLSFDKLVELRFAHQTKQATTQNMISVGTAVRRTANLEPRTYGWWHSQGRKEPRSSLHHS